MASNQKVEDFLRQKVAECFLLKSDNSPPSFDEDRKLHCIFYFNLSCDGDEKKRKTIAKLWKSLENFPPFINFVNSEYFWNFQNVAFQKNPDVYDCITQFLEAFKETNQNTEESNQKKLNESLQKLFHDTKVHFDFPKSLRHRFFSEMTNMSEVIGTANAVKCITLVTVGALFGDTRKTSLDILEVRSEQLIYLAYFCSYLFRCKAIYDQEHSQKNQPNTKNIWKSCFSALWSHLSAVYCVYLAQVMFVENYGNRIGPDMNERFGVSVIDSFSGKNGYNSGRGLDATFVGFDIFRCCVPLIVAGLFAWKPQKKNHIHPYTAFIPFFCASLFFFREYHAMPTFLNPYLDSTNNIYDSLITDDIYKFLRSDEKDIGLLMSTNNQKEQNEFSFLKSLVDLAVTKHPQQAIQLKFITRDCLLLYVSLIAWFNKFIGPFPFTNDLMYNTLPKGDERKNDTAWEESSKIHHGFSFAGLLNRYPLMDAEFVLNKVYQMWSNKDFQFRIIGRVWDDNELRNFRTNINYMRPTVTGFLFFIENLRYTEDSVNFINQQQPYQKGISIENRNGRQLPGELWKYQVNPQIFSLVDSLIVNTTKELLKRRDQRYDGVIRTDQFFRYACVDSDGRPTECRNSGEMRELYDMGAMLPGDK